MRLILILGLVALFAGIASAAQTDSILLTIVPSAQESVNISSGTHTFGSAMTLGTSRTIRVGQIENDGDVDTKWQIIATQVCNSGPAAPWTLVTADPIAKDEFRLLAITTAPAAAPTRIDTDAAMADSEDVCMAGNHVLTPTGIGVDFSAPLDITEGGASVMTHQTTGDTKTRALWVSIMLPAQITKGDTQTLTLSVVAEQP